MATKKDLNDYITTVSKLKPSAEVKFRSTDESGEVTESVASKEYVAKHADKEFDAASQIKSLNERLARVTEKAAQQAVEENDEAVEENDEIDELEQEVEDEEQLAENADVSFRNARQPQEEEESPLTYVPNASTEDPGDTQEMSETALLIQLVGKLIDKIDEMQNFNPVIHVPAPVIHVTLPETKRTVTKAVERDENNWIKTVREHVEEAPEGEPLIEVKQEEPRTEKTQTRKKRKPKDNE